MIHYRMGANQNSALLFADWSGVPYHSCITIITRLKLLPDGSQSELCIAIAIC